MTDKTMRDEIAEHLIAYSYWLTSHYESVGQNVLEADRRAGAILADPEIKEGQELREKAKSGKLVELAEDQGCKVRAVMRSGALPPDIKRIRPLPLSEPK